MILTAAWNDLEQACMDVDDRAFVDVLDKYEQPIARLALFQQRAANEESLIFRCVTYPYIVCLLDC